jgi:hypothetical protein
VNVALKIQGKEKPPGNEGSESVLRIGTWGIASGKELGPKDRQLKMVVVRGTTGTQWEKWIKEEPKGTARIIEMALGRKIPVLEQEPLGLKKEMLRGPTPEEMKAGGAGC